MKKMFFSLMVILSYYCCYSQEIETLKTKHKSLLTEISSASTSGGKGVFWIPSLVYVNNKNSFSAGGIFQQGKWFEKNGSLIYTGVMIKYQRRLAFSDNYSEFFAEINAAHRNAMQEYEYRDIIKKYDVIVPLKKYALLEYYLGFSYRSPLKHLFFWSSSIGLGGMHSSTFTEYNHEAKPYTLSINDIGLQIKASVGFRLLPKNNVQH
ncbi:MAG: hypothetical protein HUU48_12200 [Flavobacteriales bacterium]|nr:hypothetical protein [Flavobacteriales bacterium]